MDFSAYRKTSPAAVRCVGRPKKALDNESRNRRDIANNHERKRMQSINDGIQALRRILRHKDIDKLSKATVLLRSAEYVLHLETQMTALTDQNYRLKCLVKQLFHNNVISAQDITSQSPTTMLYYAHKFMSENDENPAESHYKLNISQMDDTIDDNVSDTKAIDLSKKKNN